MIFSSSVPVLVTLFHITVDNNAEAIVTKCLEFALDVQCTVVTCHLLSIISLLDRYLLQQSRRKREICRNKIPYKIAEQSSLRILSRVKKSETRDCRETAYWLQRYRTVYCITSSRSRTDVACLPQ